MTSEASIEQQIRDKGLNAPRLTPNDIDQAIEDKQFHVFGSTCLTVCCLTLKNGFTVTGESACAHPDNFNKEIGEEIAFKNAREKIWALEGYLLKEWLHRGAEAGDIMHMVANEAIARVAHEVNAAFCRAYGDDSQPSWNDAPQWQKDSAINGVIFHRENPDAGPEASHNSWMAEKEADGWVYGVEKDPGKKEHPCMVPFSELPPEQQAKDFLFRQVVHSLIGQ